jgi:hypothetical protein
MRVAHLSLKGAIYFTFSADLLRLPLKANKNP